MDILPKGSRKKTLGVLDNKQTKISSILGIQIKNFRSIKNQTLKMGAVMTLLSGRNGTMKTSIMGLVAQLFESSAKDAFDKPLKTSLHEVFKLSPKYDNIKYTYEVVAKLSDDRVLQEPVTFYYVSSETHRHRLVVSGSLRGDGTFNYNTSFLNLQRLYPIADTDAKESTSKEISISPDELANLKDFYETVFPSSEYEKFTPIVAITNKKTTKTTFGPASTSTKYDWSTISSGEDNLGAIYNRLIGFERSLNIDKTMGNGVLCIDEFESTLHPVAQLRLFDYLYRWAKKRRIQVLITTHSLHLITHTYLKYLERENQHDVVLNFISSSTADNGAYSILHNPPFEIGYKELTFEDPKVAAEARKIQVLCEDETAKHLIKRIVKSQDILRTVEIHSSLDPSSAQPGTSYTALSSVCTKFPLLLENSIVIFDADIQQSTLKKIKNKDLYLILPDKDSAAIERRIILFILGLKKADAFFTRFRKEHAAFLDSFKASGIKSLSKQDILDEKKTSIDTCKLWAKNQGAKFNQYITYYCDHLEQRDEFRNAFIAAINKINIRRGIPEVI